MIQLNAKDLFLLVVSLLALGILSTIWWAWSHKDEDEDDDRKRDLQIQQIQDEIDRLTRS